MSGTTGIVDASNIKIYVGDSPTLIAMIDNGTFAVNAATREQNHNDNAGWTGKDYGLLSGTMSGNSFFSFDGNYGFTDLFAIITGKTKVKLKWQAGTTDDNVYEGTFVLTTLEKSGGTGEDLKYSYSFESDGVIEEDPS